MAAKATRCPHCQTSFRVTESQLATARGLVRCGACLEVFTASDHWIETEPAQQPTAIASPTEPVIADDDVLFDDDNGLPDEEQPSAQQDHSLSEPDETQFDSHRDDDSAAVDNDPGDNDHEIGQEAAPEQPAIEFTPSIADNESFAEEQPDLDFSGRDDQENSADNDPLLFQSRRSLQISRQQLGWGLLSLAAVLCLSAQLIYNHFDQLAQSSYRPQLAKLCDTVNFFGSAQPCQLPPPQNLTLISSRGLNIYSHPRFANSLLVDVLIENRAVFEQPFPVIELEFQDQNGRSVALRRFAPSEYLAGELRGMEFMPSRQTVHINISILDPGTTAVNYEMQFHPANSKS